VLGVDFHILQTQIERGGLEEAALLDERLKGLEMTVYKVHREIAAISASIQSTHQRLSAAAVIGGPITGYPSDNVNN